MTMTELETDTLAAEIGRFVREEIARATAELRAEMTVKIAGAATAKALAPMWRGTWEEGISYGSNVLVNDKSALWISEQPTSARPGMPDSGWRLAVKSPR